MGNVAAGLRVLSAAVLVSTGGLGAACSSAGDTSAGQASGGIAPSGGTSSSAANGGAVSSNGGSLSKGGSTNGGSAPSTGGGAPSTGGGAPSTGGGAPNSSGSANGGSSGGGNTGGSDGALGVDVFGIEQLYPSAPSGAEWSSKHWDGEPYALTDRTDDEDPLGISGMRGDGTLTVTGDGELVMGGSEPRIYIYPSDAGPWQNLEITVYYQRVADSATAYAGLVIGARSGAEGHTEATPCEAHTYYARVRNDGAFDFEKELEHPASSPQARVAPNVAWPPAGQVPFDTWIGFKYVIYNLPSDAGVKLEAYRDLTGGAQGGTWEKVNETIDDGGWFVETDCAQHSPSDGESDLVVTAGGTTLIRNTEVTEARYRWVTVREISPSR